MTIKRILIVDDDLEIRVLLKDLLNEQGYAVHIAASGAQMRAHIDRWRIDLIILDIMLGDESGFEICRKLRHDNDVLVLMLTALSGDEDRILGLKIGADDYMAKPFNPDVLIARVNSLFRRLIRAPSLKNRVMRGRYRFNGWEIDLSNRELVSPEGHMVILSQGEFAMLTSLLLCPKTPLKREELGGPPHLEKTQGAVKSERAVDMQIMRLRGKLGDDPKTPHLIKTVRGQGYMLAADVETL